MPRTGTIISGALVSAGLAALLALGHPVAQEADAAEAPADELDPDPAPRSFHAPEAAIGLERDLEGADLFV